MCGALGAGAAQSAGLCSPEVAGRATLQWAGEEAGAVKRFSVTRSIGNLPGHTQLRVSLRLFTNTPHSGAPVVVYLGGQAAVQIAGPYTPSADCGRLAVKRGSASDGFSDFAVGPVTSFLGRTVPAAWPPEAYPLEPTGGNKARIWTQMQCYVDVSFVRAHTSGGEKFAKYRLAGENSEGDFTGPRKYF